MESSIPVALNETIQIAAVDKCCQNTTWSTFRKQIFGIRNFLKDEGGGVGRKEEGGIKR